MAIMFGPDAYYVLVTECFVVVVVVVREIFNEPGTVVKDIYI
jgi:hypothetical protein